MTLKDSLEALGLRHTAEHMDDVIAHTTRHKMSPLQALEFLAHGEIEARGRKSLERRLDRKSVV